MNFLKTQNEEVKSLEEIIGCIDNTENNLRIAKSLELNKQILILMQNKINPFILSKLDYKIQNINHLANDKTIEPIVRASNAMKRFSRLSMSEIVTPEKITNAIVDILPKDAIKNTTKILDIAAKQGEFVYAIYQKYGNVVANNFYSIPTSKIAYEFTRKVYEMLDLNIKNIAIFTSYELLTIKKENNDREVDFEKVRNLLCQNKNFNEIKLTDNIKEGGNNMCSFNVVIGNPPYQEIDKEDGTGSAKPLYHQFINMARKIQPHYASLITPSVWFLGGKGLDDFRQEMLLDKHFQRFDNFITSKDVFDNVNLRGGVNYFLWARDYDNSKKGIKVVEYKNNEIISEEVRNYSIPNLNLFISDNIGYNIVTRLLKDNTISTNIESENMLSKYISVRNPFGFATTFVRHKNFETNISNTSNYYKIYAAKGKIGYVKKNLLSDENIDLLKGIKVITPFANNIGTDLPDDNLNLTIIQPNELVTETFLLIGQGLNLTDKTAKNLYNYLQTKFVRFLISLAKANQNGTRQTYRFVPLQDFTQEWTDEKLFDKYKISTEEQEYIKTKVRAMNSKVRQKMPAYNKRSHCTTPNFQ